MERENTDERVERAFCIMRRFRNGRMFVKEMFVRMREVLIWE